MVTVNKTEARISVQVESTGAPGLKGPETRGLSLDAATKLDGLSESLKHLLGNLAYQEDHCNCRWF